MENNFNKLSIIIPAYNERQTIHFFLDKLRQVTLLKSLNFDIKKEICFAFLLFIIIFFNLKSNNWFSNQYNYKKIMSYIYLPKDFYYLKIEKNIQYQEFQLKAKNNTNYKFYSAFGDTQTFDKFPCTVIYLGKTELIGETVQEGFKHKN